MNEKYEFMQITQKDLNAYKSVLLPMVYDELREQTHIETEYIGI